MTEKLSPLDTERFGFNIARVNDFNTDVRSRLEAFRTLDTKLIIARVDAVDLDLVNRLEKNGFCIKDIQQTYNFDFTKAKIPNQVDNLPFALRFARPEDADQIATLAGSALESHGHYYADKRLDPTLCGAIYADWARKSCRDNAVADKVILAEREGRVIGFLSLKNHGRAGERYCAGVIGAVAVGYHGMGIFRAINIAALQWANTLAVDRLEHNVLVTNYPINRTLAGLGFVVVRSAITLHGWLDEMSCDRSSDE